MKSRNIMTKKILILAVSLFMIMTVFQSPVHAMAENSNKEYTKGTSLGLSHPSLVMVKGNQKQIYARVTGSNAKVIWTTSKPSVATVVNGKVTAKGYGNAVITASANGIRRYCKVKVLPSIRLHVNSTTLVQGKSFRLWASVDGPSKKVTWKVGNSRVAFVSSKGIVKAKNPGKTTVYATANGKTARCVITVKPAPGYKTLYKEFLSRGKLTVSNYSFRPAFFYMINIDQKGVPELIITDKYTSPTVTYYVYTVRDGSVRYMGKCALKGMSHHPTFQYSQKYKGIYVGGWINGVGGSWSALYGISGTKLVRKQHGEEYHPYGQRDTYYIGHTDRESRRVSRSECAAFVRRYMGNLKKYTMISNTSSNRNRYLK